MTFVWREIGSTSYDMFGMVFLVEHWFCCTSLGCTLDINNYVLGDFDQMLF